MDLEELFVKAVLGVAERKDGDRMVQLRFPGSGSYAAAAASSSSSPAKGGGLRPGVGTTPRSAAPLPALRRGTGAGESARRLLGAHAPRALAGARRRAWAGVGAAATQRAERGGGFPGGCPAAAAPRS